MSTYYATFRIINEAKDEPVIIYCNDNKQGTIGNLKNLLDGVFSGTECAGMGKLNSVPIIISDNFFQLIEWTEEPKRILPLIVNTEEEFTREISSADTATSFIKWCVDKYDLVTTILKTHTRATSQDSSLEKSFFAILMIADIFLSKAEITGKEQILSVKYINRIKNKCKKLQDYLKRFLDNTETEMFGQWLSQCFTSGELTLKHNNDVTKSELNGKVVVYSDSGEIYFDEEAFKTVLKKGKVMDYDFTLKALAEQDAIQTEKKENGSVTYKVKCAVPSGCGRNQRRMIKFHAGVLMDEEGAAFDGELLQDKKSSAVIKEPYYLEIGTRGNGKMLYYNPYSEGNTNAMVLITGKSGSGKTNFSYNVIRQAIKEEMIVLVPDFSDSFEAGKVAGLDNSRVFSVADFPASPFSKITPDEDKKTTARRCSNLLSRVFNMGVQQEKILNDVIMSLLNTDCPVTLSNIAKAICYIGAPELENIRRLSIYGTLNAFEKSDKSWSDIYTDSAGLYVIKFNECYTSQDKINCTELLLLSLFEWLHAHGQENCNRKLQIHLDEAQSLRYSEKSPLTLLMRQGRKFGCSMFLYTQSMETFDKDVQEILMQAALIVNFQQTPQGAGKLAKLLEDDEKEAKELARQLKHLKKGQAITTGCFQKGNGMPTDIINVKVQTSLAESR